MCATMWTKKPSAISLTWHRLMTLIGVLVLLTILDGTLPVPLQSHDGPSQRFLILQEFQGEAVFDRETQLIWERTPGPAETRWKNAGVLCALKSVGGRPGWRLPTFFELMTLVDPTRHDPTRTPLLPVEHPFTGIGDQTYWSSNTHATEATKAYAVDFTVGDVAAVHKHMAHRLWCVRGGSLPPADRKEELVRRSPQWS